MNEQRRPDQVIDVELLVEELKTRVARERAAGAYADDLSGVALQKQPPEDAIAPLEPAYDSDAPRVRLRPELGFSSKRVIGRPITLVKQFILRLLFFVLDDLARQTDAALGRIEVALAVHAGDLQREAQRFNAEVDRIDTRVTSEVGAREAVQTDVKSLGEQLAEIERRLDHLQLEPRLARLERARRQAPTRAAFASPAPDAVAAPSFDYERFEDRFRPETSVRERQRDYVELMRGRKRVVDLGCGRGELIEMLEAEGISAYGVEINPDFVALLEEKGIEVVAKDAVAHLEELEAGSVDGVVGSHLVEHLAPRSVSRLVALAAEKLADGGVLILETPNPESLVAGSINFHRDLSHVRPIHPDTLAFLAESAGFSKVEIRRLSPVPEDERLPAPEDERLEGIVTQLNELLYGFQDYAVVARK